MPEPHATDKTPLKIPLTIQLSADVAARLKVAAEAQRRSPRRLCGRVAQSPSSPPASRRHDEGQHSLLVAAGYAPANGVGQADCLTQ